MVDETGVEVVSGEEFVQAIEETGRDVTEVVEENKKEIYVIFESEELDLPEYNSEK